MEIIIVNGPPRSGKGTLVGHLLKHIDQAVYCSFKEPLYLAMMSFYGLSRDELMHYVDSELKDTPLQLFSGKSPREALIELDNRIKEARGNTAIADDVISTILDTPDYGRKTFVFPDGGVDGEVDYMERVLKHYGLLKLTIVQVRKNGCDFKGDTRRYLDNPNIVVTNDVKERAGIEGKLMYQQFVDQYY